MVLNRNTRLSQSDINQIKKAHGYICKACGIDFAKFYPDIGEDFIEAHHMIPYSDMKDGAKRKLNEDDFVMLCPNCHSMIHRLENPADLDRLKMIIAKGRDKK